MTLTGNLGSRILKRAYTNKNGFPYYLIRTVLRSKNKFFRKHVTRRAKKLIERYANNNTNNLGFHAVATGKKTFVECFSSDINTAIVYFGVESDDIVNLYKKYLVDNEIFLDIGANVGIHALLSLTANSTIEVHAFEPSPDIFQRLLRNIKRNEIKEVKAYQLALANQLGEIYFDDKSKGANIGISKISEIPTETRVAVSTVDALFLGSEKRIGLIKIDVEGFEPDVLSGSKGILERDKPTILLEFNSHHYPIEDIVKHIPYEFDLYVVSGGEICPVENIDSLNLIHRAKDLLICEK